MPLLYTMSQLKEAAQLEGRQSQHWVKTGALVPAELAAGKGQQNRFEASEIEVAVLLQQLHAVGVQSGVLVEAAHALRQVMKFRRRAVRFENGAPTRYWRECQRETEWGDVQKSLSSGGGAGMPITKIKKKSPEELLRQQEEALLELCAIATERTLRGYGPHALGIAMRQEENQCVCVPMFRMRDSFGPVPGPSGEFSPFFIVNLGPLFGIFDDA